MEFGKIFPPTDGQQVIVANGFIIVAIMIRSSLLTVSNTFEIIKKSFQNNCKSLHFQNYNFLETLTSHNIWIPKYLNSSIFWRRFSPQLKSSENIGSYCNKRKHTSLIQLTAILSLPLAISLNRKAHSNNQHMKDGDIILHAKDTLS